MMSHKTMLVKTVLTIFDGGWGWGGGTYVTHKNTKLSVTLSAS